VKTGTYAFFSGTFAILDGRSSDDALPSTEVAAVLGVAAPLVKSNFRVLGVVDPDASCSSEGSRWRLPRRGIVGRRVAKKRAVYERAGDDPGLKRSSRSTLFYHATRPRPEKDGRAGLRWQSLVGKGEPVALRFRYSDLDTFATRAPRFISTDPTVLQGSKGISDKH
jgi:hypothetical protein